MNAPLEYQNFSDLSIEKPKQSARQVKNGEETERKKKETISPQLLFSRLLGSGGDFATQEGIIYNYTGTHWQALKPEEVERSAFAWLSSSHPDKTSEKLARSCAASASLHLHKMPPPVKNSNIILVPCTNGTVHAESEGVALHPHSKNDYITYCLNCEFRESETSKMWTDFLSQAMPDSDVRAFLQEYVGYTLMPDTRHQVCLWLVGDGGTGKGTFSQVVAALHDPVNVAGMKIDAGSLSGFNLSPLIGASLVLVDETPPRIDEQHIKTLISGDLTSADRKFRDVVNFRPCAKWIICGNAMPNFSDQTGGIWRRIFVVPFSQKPERSTKLLAETIIDKELPAVLNWALEGLQRLLWRGRFPDLPVAMAARKKQARLESDSVLCFLSETEPAPVTEGKGGGMSKTYIYQKYAAWCITTGLKSVSSIKFWARVCSTYPDLAEFRRGSERTRCFPLLFPSDSR